MAECSKCHMVGLEWYQDQFGKSHLGVKLDVNTYRKHQCPTKLASVPKKKTQKTHEWCFQCDISILLSAPCEHLAKKSMTL